MFKTYLSRLVSSPTIRLVTAVTGGSLFGTLIALVGSLVQSRFVGPEDLGYFRQFGIVTGYMFFIHLGVWHALQRQYPYYVGQGRQDRALAVAEVCQAWTATISGLAAGFFVIMAAASMAGGNWRAMLAWLVQAVTIVGSVYGGYLGATYRSSHDFKTAAKSEVVNAVAGLLTLPFFPAWPYPALALRSGLSSLVSSIYLHVRRPLRLPWRFSGREWSELVKSGLPLFMASYGASVGWSAVEASLIIKGLGASALGLWSVSVMMFETANKAPQAVVAVYAPRLIEQFGRTGSYRDALQLCRRPILWGITGMVSFGIASYAAVPFAVKWLIPKYTAAIPTMCLMLLYLPFLILEMPYSLLVGGGHWAKLNIASYVGLGCFILLALLALRLDWGLNGVVGASLLGKAGRMAVMYAFIGAHLRREGGNGGAMA
jgi:O-antigen/teichoic acid export membrane protein